MKKKILPLTVVENQGRYEVRLAGRLISIRTRSGTWMEARFDTREAADGYRRALLGDLPPDFPRKNRGTVTCKKARQADGRRE